LSISSAIIQDIEALRAAGLATLAYYYFDFRDVRKQDRNGLLSSLLSQLSIKSDSCYEVLSQFYFDNASGTGRPDNAALTKCIRDMLSLPRQGQVYIIIDALDECPDTSGTPSAREDVLDLIDELIDPNLPNVHLCVASRPEIDIRNALEPLKPLEVSLHDEDGQKNDIITYIRSVVYSDRKMRSWREEDKRLVIDMLSSGADGMYVVLHAVRSFTTDTHVIA
jgi:NACHT domain